MLDAVLFIIFGSITFSYGELEKLENDALEEDRETDIQSCSSLCPNGLDGRFGLSVIGTPSRPFGTGTWARAGCLLSSHHFCRSELAGGRPGSMAS